MGRRSLTDYSNRILVADDEPHNLELLQLFLEEKDYLVETASDGQAAWEKLTTEPDRYMVVLLDRMMPNMRLSNPLRVIVPVLALHQG